MLHVCLQSFVCFHASYKVGDMRGDADASLVNKMTKLCPPC